MNTINFKNILLDDGLAAYQGTVEKTKFHKHYATEIIISLDGSFKVIGNDGLPSEYKLALIKHNVPHQFDCHQCENPLFIFLDPFHVLSQNLTHHFDLNRDIVKLDELISRKFMSNCCDLFMKGNLFSKRIKQIVSSIAPETYKFSNKDDRITKSFEFIKQNLDREIKIEAIANMVNLSSSRYAHLFKETANIPFRRFVLWSKLQRALESVIDGNSLTVACHDGGFFDQSHFTKTFIEMFGVTPSSVLKH
ncbi:MAG: AraC family transcriptional regulator [Fulvivirga sp.]